MTSAGSPTQVRFRVSVLFGIAGFFSGLTTVLVYSRQSGPAWNIAGVTFLVALAGSIVVAKNLGWLSTGFRAKRCVAAAVVIVASHPAAIWVSSLVEFFCELICRLVAAPPICKHQAVSVWTGFLESTLYTCLAAAAAVSIALWLLTQRWEAGEFALLVLGGIGAAWISLVLAASLLDLGCSIKFNGQDWTFFLILAMLGESVLSVVSARWIGKQGVG